LLGLSADWRATVAAARTARCHWRRPTATTAADAVFDVVAGFLGNDGHGFVAEVEAIEL
jgi:hypothetical protein